jgi:GT2 family glycosyltransferase
MTGPAGHPLISVIIVNYNGASVLPACLASVYRQPYRPIEVILIDNGSTDGSVDDAGSLFPELRIIRNASNLGFAPANNQGVAAATGGIIVLLNNDTVVEDGWLPGLLAVMEQPGVGVVTSRVVTDGVPAAFYEMNGTLNYLGYNIMRHFTDLSMIFFAGGASLMFRRDDAPEPFPAEYFIYHEDVYLSWRLRLLGKDVRMSQSSVVLHRGSVTTRRQTGRTVTFYQERNRLLNALVMYEGGTLVLLIPYFVADLVAKLLLSLVNGRKSFLGILEGLVWVVTHADRVAARRRKAQAERRVPDSTILRLMSSKVVEGNGALADAANTISQVYARMTGLER